MVARSIRRNDAARVGLCAGHESVTGMSRWMAKLSGMNLSNSLHPRPINAPRLLALGGALLWGALEFVALWRSRWTQRLRQ
jgi:hypothetical protein